MNINIDEQQAFLDGHTQPMFICDLNEGDRFIQGFSREICSWYVYKVKKIQIYEQGDGQIITIQGPNIIFNNHKKAIVRKLNGDVDAIEFMALRVSLAVQELPVSVIDRLIRILNGLSSIS